MTVLEGMRRASWSSVPKTVGALALLQAALPVNLAVTGAALVRTLVRDEPQYPRSGPPKTVLISGGKMTKALQLARSFHRAGHRVILVESAKYRLTGHRFSRDVDLFRTVPEPGAPGYTDALLEIVRAENVDVYVPVCSPAASIHDAVAKPRLAEFCDVLHGDEQTVRRLDDKYEFATMAADIGLPVPDSHRVTSAAEVERFDFAGHDEQYILKSIPYDPVHRLDLTTLPRPTDRETAQFAESKPFSAAKPWIMQAFVPGQEYCTHATVRDGRMQVYCCCASSAFQVNYEMVDKPAIREWVERFARHYGLTGQVSFDFIESADGRAYAIECNPRTHSAITMLYDNPDVARAYLEDGGAVVTPTPASRPTYWIYHELWRLLSRPRDIRHRLAVIARGKDAIFDRDDPLPFLIEHHVQIPWLLLRKLWPPQDWIRIDFNIGKLVEPGGD